MDAIPVWLKHSCFSKFATSASRPLCAHSSLLHGCLTLAARCIAGLSSQGKASHRSGVDADHDGDHHDGHARHDSGQRDRRSSGTCSATNRRLARVAGQWLRLAWLARGVQNRHGSYGDYGGRVLAQHHLQV